MAGGRKFLRAPDPHVARAGGRGRFGQDPLGEQLTALRRRGIKAPVYVSVLWDDLAGVLHPEWIATDRQGRLLAQPPFSGASVMTGGIGWTTYAHTGIPVPIFAKGLGSELFAGYYDNTDVAWKTMSVLGVR
mgnify:CR=1 FL=1